MSEPTDQSVPETAESVDEDVERVIVTHTGDGKGDDDPGESDFISFAADDAEREVEIEEQYK